MAKEKEVVENEEVKNEVATTEEATKMEVDAFAGYDLTELGFTEEEIAELSGLDSIDSSEISIPYASLISKATKENEIGDIVFPDGTVIKGKNGEVVEKIAILNVQKVRVYFPQPFSPKNTFICRSLDGVVGAPDGDFAGQPCATCEFAKYPEDGGSSPCRDQRLLLCAREDGSLFHLQVAGVGMKVWRKYMSAQVFHMLPKARGIMGALNVTIGVTMIDTDYGPFPALDFKVDSKKPFHEPSRLIESLSALKSYKEFIVEHASSAAAQTRVEMAAEEGPATGKNTELF